MIKKSLILTVCITLILSPYSFAASRCVMQSKDQAFSLKTLEFGEGRQKKYAFALCDNKVGECRGLLTQKPVTGDHTDILNLRTFSEEQLMQRYSDLDSSVFWSKAGRLAMTAIVAVVGVALGVIIAPAIFAGSWAAAGLFGTLGGAAGGVTGGLLGYFKLNGYEAEEEEKRDIMDITVNNQNNCLEVDNIAQTSLRVKKILLDLDANSLPLGLSAENENRSSRSAK